MGVVVRSAERLLPHALLLLLWPAAFLLSLRELFSRGPTVRQMHQLPASFRPPGSRARGFARLVFGRVALNATKFLRFWPDRLRERRWQRRFRVEGGEILDAAVASGRPVVLLMLHYGPITELYHWLRAGGRPVIGMVARELDRADGYHGYLNDLSDQANGLTGVARFFSIAQFWEVRDFLSAPGRMLLVPIDGYPGKRPVAVAGGDYELNVGAGVFVLAAATNAVVIPISATATPTLATHVRFLAPVPDEHLADRKRHPAACEHVVRHLVPLIQAAPEQCAPQFLWSLRDTTTSVK